MAMIDQIAARHKLAVARVGIDPNTSTMDNPPRSFKLLGRELKLLKDVGPQLAMYKSNSSLIYALSPISAVGVVLWNDRQDSYARVVASFTTSHVFALDNALTSPFDAHKLEKELDKRLAKLGQYRQRVEEQLFLDAHQIGARVSSESDVISVNDPPKTITLYGRKLKLLDESQLVGDLADYATAFSGHLFIYGLSEESDFGIALNKYNDMFRVMSYLRDTGYHHGRDFLHGTSLIELQRAIEAQLSSISRKVNIALTKDAKRVS